MNLSRRATYAELLRLVPSFTRCFRELNRKVVAGVDIVALFFTLDIMVK